MCRLKESLLSYCRYLIFILQQHICNSSLPDADKVHPTDMKINNPVKMTLCLPAMALTICEKRKVQECLSALWGPFIAAAKEQRARGGAFQREPQVIYNTHTHTHRTRLKSIHFSLFLCSFPSCTVWMMWHVTGVKKQTSLLVWTDTFEQLFSNLFSIM